jgi:hypothetical protein
MAKISTYPGADVPLQLSDRLIGTEAIRPIPTSTPLATKNFSLGELLQLFSSNFPAASLQAVLDTGNTATQNINLIGTIDATLIRPDNIEDTSGSQGLTFQFLSKGASSINWVDLPVDNLQQVLNTGNTATQNITLIGNITSTKIIPGNIQDDTLGIGTTGQILSKTATGIRWINNPTVFTPGLADVLSVGNTATNDITLIGNIIATKAIPTNIQDETASIGSSGQILSKTALGIRWINSSSSITPSPLTKVDDTNVTLTLGGTPATSLLQAVSLTLGWTGTLADSRITSASNWNTAYNNRITSLTTIGTGPATLISNVLNIPTSPTPPLETITEGGNTGIAIRGRNPLNYGNIGSNAVDLSYSTGPSSTIGATGLNSYAEGSDNTASGQYSHAEGQYTLASGTASHAEGYATTASGDYSHAEGEGSIASGQGTHAKGRYTKATINGAYAEGGNTEATGQYSHAQGLSTFARSIGEHSGGLYATDYTESGNSTDRLVNYGNGVDNANRSDAFTIFKNGAVRFFRATLASITNDSAGFFIFDSGNSNRPTIHNGTAWKALAYTDDITTGVTSVSATSPITSSGGTTPNISTSMSTNKLIGRSTAGTGVMEEITIGTGLTLSGGTLNGSATGVTSVGLTMPSAFTVTNSPITSTGDIAVTGAGLVSQYIRGDGTLANFPNSTGGGASVNYYLNGSVSQGTFGGNTYYQMSKTPILGAGTNFIRTNGAGNGYIASFITDAGDPSFLNIPGGNWNLEFYFQSSASGGSPQFYGEIYKVSATNVFTLVASGSVNPEGITNGTTVDQYFTSIPVPQTSLLITDRLAVRIYIITSGRTITLHTENGNLCEVLTTFTTGLTALNGLTQQVQYFATGTSGTDFNISSVTDTHTFNLPIASSSNTGKLSSTDWSTFNTAFTDRFKWDGGSSGLVAATGRTSLGANTVGSNLFTLANPSAITFIRINADNSISTLDAASFVTAIGVTSSQWITSGSNISYSTGNVAIGTTPVATSRLNITDTTLAGSGSLAGNALSLNQTWNTTGQPTALLLDVTDTASNATSWLTQFRVGVNPVFNPVFRIDKNGVIHTSRLANIGAPTTSYIDILANSHEYRSGTPQVGGSGILLATGANSLTSGVYNAIRIISTTNPGSGNNEANYLTINSTINQGGTSSGKIRGFYFNPITTSVRGDLIAFEATAGRIVYTSTITPAGTTGAQTINRISGKVNAAAGTTSLVVTNNLVTTSSIVMCQLGTNDATCVIRSVVEANLSFTINYAAPTAETVIKFTVIN